MKSAYPAFARVPVWSSLSGMSRGRTYLALGRGDLRAVKEGRCLLVDVEHGLAWLRSLPAAKILPPEAAAK